MAATVPTKEKFAAPHCTPAAAPLAERRGAPVSSCCSCLIFPFFRDRSSPGFSVKVECDVVTDQYEWSPVFDIAESV